MLSSVSGWSGPSLAFRSLSASSKCGMASFSRSPVHIGHGEVVHALEGVGVVGAERRLPHGQRPREQLRRPVVQPQARYVSPRVWSNSPLIFEAPGNSASRSRVAWSSRSTTLTCRPSWLGSGRRKMSTRRRLTASACRRASSDSVSRWLASRSAVVAQDRQERADDRSDQDHRREPGERDQSPRGACRANLRSRYAADGGHASTGSSCR